MHLNMHFSVSTIRCEGSKACILLQEHGKS